jgi:ATP diphosphatase
MTPSRDIARLIDIMAALRARDGGCPWDLEQTFASIAPYTLEEAHEVADAIERGDMDDLCEELGDLLLQVVFLARLAEEEGRFDFGAVVEAITTKLIRRHPHVFGDGEARTAGMVKEVWDRIKAEEKAERAARRAAAGLPPPPTGLLAGVSRGLAPFDRAIRLQAKAGTVGFDWNDPRAVLAKIREEIDEFEAELDTADAAAAAGSVPEAAPEAPASAGIAARQEEELGDVLFAVANLARHLDLDPDTALRRANEKFRRRFNHIEATLAARGLGFADVTLDEMEAIWQAAKAFD